MKKTIAEDYEFTITVLSVGKDNKPEHCRMGFEVNDTFICKYDCPSGFCPKTMVKLYTICEAVRSGGDLRKLGGYDKMGMQFSCADGPALFDVKAVKLTV